MASHHLQVDDVDYIDVEELRASFLDREKRLLLGVDLVNATPALVGSWTGHAYSDTGRLLLEPPRATDIAGKARWWLRSVLAGGVYELTGGHVPIYVLDEIASQIMGSTSYASKIVFRLKPLGATSGLRWRRVSPCLNMNAFTTGGYPTLFDLDPEGVDEHQLQERIRRGREALISRKSPYRQPRVVLQALGKKGLELAGNIPLPPGYYRFRLELWLRPGAELDPLEEEVLGNALGLALFAAGIGRGVTRGFGKLAPIGGEAEGRLSSKVLDIYRRLREGSPMEGLAEDASSAAKRYLEELFLCRSRERAQWRLCRELGRELADYPFTHTFHPEWVHTIDRTIDVFQQPFSDVGLLLSDFTKDTQLGRTLREKFEAKIPCEERDLLPLYLGLPRRNARSLLKSKNIYKFKKERNITQRRLVSAFYLIPVASVDYRRGFEGFHRVYAVWFRFGDAFIKWVTKGDP